MALTIPFIGTIGRVPKTGRSGTSIDDFGKSVIIIVGIVTAGYVLTKVLK